MPRVLDPFRFVLIAVAGWMNQHSAMQTESTFGVRFLMRQPDMCWILAVRASTNKVTVGIGQRIMPVRVDFLTTPRLTAFIQHGNANKQYIGGKQ